MRIPILTVRQVLALQGFGINVVILNVETLFILEIAECSVVLEIIPKVKQTQKKNNKLIQVVVEQSGRVHHRRETDSERGRKGKYYQNLIRCPPILILLQW